MVLDKRVVDKVLDKLRELFTKRYRDYIAYAYLFGSVVEGRATCESDIDIAIRFYNSVSKREQWRIVKEISGDVSEDIDLVILSIDSPVLCMSVFSHGVLFYCRDKWLLFLDHNRVLKLYNDFLYIARPYKERLMECIEKGITK